MKKLKIVSKYIQIVVLLSFLLPFFPSGCEPKKTEEVQGTDSTMVRTDTSRTDTSKLVMANPAVNQGNDSIKQNITDKLSKKSGILKLMLRPEGNYSGIGYLMVVFKNLATDYGVAIAFILWALSLVVKWKDYNNIFYLLNLLALIFFSFTQPDMDNTFLNIKLWGYWVGFGLGVILVIYDTFVLLKMRRKMEL